MKLSAQMILAPALLGAVLALPLLSAGCSKSDNRGVDVKVGGGEGVRVEAPGVDVKVGGGEGVQVDAPGTNVDVGGQE